MTRGPKSFEITCPQCRTTLVAKAEQVGTVITCSDCLEEFVVSQPPDGAQPAHGELAERSHEDWLDDTADEQASIADWGDDPDWAEDRRQLDVLLNVDVSPSKNSPTKRPSNPSADQPYDFTVACLLCGTRQEAKSEQIGGTLRCPDCHSHFEVREPSRKARRPRHPSAQPDDDEIRLREPEPVLDTNREFRDRSPGLGKMRPVVPPSEPIQPPRIMTPEDASRDTLAKAQRELDEQLKQERPLPSRAMTSGVFRFLQNPTMALRVFFLSLGLWLEWGTIQVAIGLTDAGPLQQFASVILRPLAVVFGLLFAGHFATLLLVVTQETSQGHDEIENLPGFNPVEWISESWPLFASLFLSLVLPGFVAQTLYSTTGSSGNLFWFGAVPAAIALATVFPVLLLSFLVSGTPLSATVLRGLQLSARSWLIFTIQALAIVSLGLGLCAMRANSSSMFWSFVACSGLIVTSLLYFRLLGRLVGVCQAGRSAAP